MRFLRVGLMLMVTVLAAVFLPAQTSQGRIAGRVTDVSGAVVPNATVTVLNTQTGVKRVLQTNSAGDYVAPTLSPGVYSVSASAPTFKTLERKDIRLEVATNIQIDFELKAGQISEVMEVSGEQPLVDTISDTLGGTMTNQMINQLPLQGRDFQNLLELRPGIQRIPGRRFSQRNHQREPSRGQ